MLPEYKRRTNIGVGLGLLAQIVGWISGGVAEGLFNAGLPVFGLFAGLGALVIELGGLVLFIWGCCCYALGKGYHWAVGLLGLLSILGLIALVLLPDRYREIPPKKAPPK